MLYHTDVIGILERSKQSVPRITNLALHPSALPHELLLNDASSFLSLKDVHTLDVRLYDMAIGCRLRDVLSGRLCTLRNLIVVHMRGNVGCKCMTIPSVIITHDISSLVLTAIDFPAQGYEPSPFIDGITVLVPMVPSTDAYSIGGELERITFYVTLVINTGDCTQWERLDGLLCTRSFPALMAVVLCGRRIQSS